MKVKKCIVALLSVCAAMSAVSLSACDETETSSSPSSPISSSSSGSSSNPAEEAVSTTVNETEWSAALSPTAFSNFTASGSSTEESVEDGLFAVSFVAEFDTDKLKTTYTENGLPYVTYTAIENGKLYTYMDILGNDNYTKVDMNVDASLFPSAAYLSPATELFNFTNLYSSFTYNEETRTYTATSIQIDPTLAYENVTLQFEDGALVSYSATIKQTENDVTILTGESKLTFSKYGATSVVLPAVESEPSVKGDGIITASEWIAALSASAFENVKMTCAISFTEEDGTTTTDTMTIYFDNSDIVKINASFNGVLDGEPYSIISDQYWTNYNRVYVSGNIDGYVIGWVALEDDDSSSYETAQNCRDSFTMFANEFFYSLFEFDGYEATFDSDDGYKITVRFNEQEQLVYFGDNEMQISLSNYGTIDNQLPAEAY